MTGANSKGYVLAGALASLVSMSIVATALVSASVGALRSAKSAERAAADDLALQSAILVVAAELATDPRRRNIELAANEATIGVAGRQIVVKISFEGQRLDLNLASPEAIDAALVAAGALAETRRSLGASITEFRGSGRQARFADDIASGERLACLGAVTTPFGGLNELLPDVGGNDAPIGRPGAGARLRLEARLTEGERSAGWTTVVLMTGGGREPFWTLDSRRSNPTGEEACRGH